METIDKKIDREMHHAASHISELIFLYSRAGLLVSTQNTCMNVLAGDIVKIIERSVLDREVTDLLYDDEYKFLHDLLIHIKNEIQLNNEEGKLNE